MGSQAPSDFLLSEDRSDYVLAGVIPCLSLAIISTVLRFVSRRIQQNSINVSDVIIAAAAVSGICIGSICFEGLGIYFLMIRSTFLIWGIAAIKYGFGRHASTISGADLEIFLKLFFAAEIFYVSTITLTKISILIFYCSIFPGEKFRLAAKIVGAVVLAWATACIFGVVFSCVPVAAFWDLSLKSRATCINSTTFFVANAIPNILTDATILILPIGHVWRLKMSWQRRTMVSGIFLLGSFVLVASVLRLVLLYNQDLNDPTFGLVNAFTWSNIEVDVAILSANLPLLKPLIQKIWPSQALNKTSKISLPSNGGSGVYGVNTHLVARDERKNIVTQYRTYSVVGNVAHNEDPHEQMQKSYRCYVERV